MDTQRLDSPDPRNRKLVPAIVIALLGLAAIIIAVIALRRDDDTRPYEPASKAVDDSTLPAPSVLPLGEPGSTATAPEVAPAPGAVASPGPGQRDEVRRDRDGTQVTGEARTGAPAVGEAEVVESFPARRVTDPAVIRLSRQQMQLMRHFELEKTNVVAKVCLDTNGVPNDVSVVRSSGVDEVDKATVETIRSWTYLPQITDGRLVASCTDVKVNYQLEE